MLLHMAAKGSKRYRVPPQHLTCALLAASSSDHGLRLNFCAWQVRVQALRLGSVGLSSSAIFPACCRSYQTVLGIPKRTSTHTNTVAVSSASKRDRRLPYSWPMRASSSVRAWSGRNAHGSWKCSKNEQ